VLLVDDAPDVHELVRVWLMDEPVDLADCYDGAACLQAARAAPPPDLILLDVDLPGADGFALCQALKSDPATADIPVIFLTGASSSDEKLHGLEMGATDYVTKPFEPAELRARVRSALRTRHLMNLLARDVGRRKRLEELERDRARVLERVAVGGALEDVLADVTAILERHHPDVPACILSLNEGELRVVGPSLPIDFLTTLRANALPLAADLCSGAATGGLDAVTSDVRADRPWRPLREAAARHGLRVCTSRLVQSAAQGVIGLVCVFLPPDGESDPDLHHLLDVAAGLVAVVAEHRHLGERLTYQARHDPLTGLPNRLLFESRLHQAIDDARQQGAAAQVALLLFDIDRFKLVNDTLGHPAGDDLLRQFAQRVLGVTHQTDTLARLGGDEFALLLPDVTGRDDVAAVAHAIRAAVRPPFHLAGLDRVVTTSIGAALFPLDAPDLQTLQSRADLALYRVKADGRNAYRCYDPTMGAAA
jgi:diguanylate cyclase (GGDEF)-like protein